MWSPDRTHRGRRFAVDVSAGDPSICTVRLEGIDPGSATAMITAAPTTRTQRRSWLAIYETASGPAGLATEAGIR